MILTTGVATAAALTAHPVRADSTGGLAAVDHPAGWFGAVQGPLIMVTVGLSLAFIARQALSWRRATGDRRQQLKWLASGAAVTIVCLVLATTLNTSGTPATLPGVIGSIAWFGIAALPVSIGVAILKYRLYDIDRIISRTLAYAIVTALLGLLVIPLIPAAVTIAILRYQLLDIRLVLSRTLVYGVLTAAAAGVYAGLVALLDVLVRSRVNLGSAVAASIVVAIGFNPARVRF